MRFLRGFEEIVEVDMREFLKNDQRHPVVHR